ncbi:MAG: glycosyltransferase family A protein [Methanomassiliicoccales archaeon]|jgi:glycosyltransferase involved in cell wall biosynthesis
MSTCNRTVDVTIFILSYNRPQYLKEALDSVLKQETKPQKIIVLDNGSNQEVNEIIQTEVSNGVEWIGSDINHPSIWNFRRAIEIARGKYFIMMHDDDRLLPHYLGSMFDYLERNPDVIAVGCNAFIIDGNGKRFGTSLIKFENEIIVTYSNPGEMAHLYTHSFLPYPSVLYRNGFPQKVPLREEYGQVGDSLFLCELTKYGKISYINNEGFEYRIHKGQDSSYIPFELIRYRNELLLEMAKGNDLLIKKMTHNIAVAETKLALMEIANVAIKTKSIRQVIQKMEKVRSPNFNPFLIFQAFHQYRMDVGFFSKYIFKD